MADGYLLSENSARRLAGLLKATPNTMRPRMPADAYRNDPQSAMIVENTTTEIIPAYAVMQPHDLTDQNGRAVIHVKKWDGHYPGPFLFNSSNAIPVDGNGMAQSGPRFRCLYVSGYDPEAGDFAGPVSGQWYLNENVPLMTVFGVIDSTARHLVAIMEVPPVINIAAPSGGIPAASGYTAGTASCKLLRNSAGVAKDTGKTLTVLNWANSIVCANGYRRGKASPAEMTWEIISEDCSDVRAYSAPASL